MGRGVMRDLISSASTHQQIFTLVRHFATLLSLLVSAAFVVDVYAGWRVKETRLESLQVILALSYKMKRRATVLVEYTVRRTSGVK